MKYEAPRNRSIRQLQVYPKYGRETLPKLGNICMRVPIRYVRIILLNNAETRKIHAIV
jgi:hypothetical protein